MSNTKNKIVLIELNLYASYHNGINFKEYNENVFITIQDYIKYFGSGQDTKAKTFEDYVKNTWENVKISIGQFDDKHNEIFGDIDIGFWDCNEIAEHYNDEIKSNPNSGNILFSLIVDKAIGANVSLDEKKKFLNEIELHTKDVVDSIGTNITVNVLIPKERLLELLEFVEKLNK